ncbi:hypothetical protein [Proteus mirabilis]|uniref:hypothetical protein n=1 Tax=Proteus mirabilis TaxID=584 RepID=UPI0034D4082C
MSTKANRCLNGVTFHVRLKSFKRDEFLSTLEKLEIKIDPENYATCMNDFIEYKFICSGLSTKLLETELKKLFSNGNHGGFSNSLLNAVGGHKVKMDNMGLPVLENKFYDPEFYEV